MSTYHTPRPTGNWLGVVGGGTKVHLISIDYPICGAGTATGFHNFRRARVKPAALNAKVTCDKCLAKGKDKLYDIYYAKPSAYTLHTMSDSRAPYPSPVTLAMTHTFVRQVFAQNKEEVFAAMQGEVWSPRGEAVGLIQRSGLAHTSMSIGDVLAAPDGLYAVAEIGFEKIGERS